MEEVSEYIGAPWEVKYMPVPKANQRAVNKYKKNNYDRIEITVPKGQRDIFQAHAAARGESTNAFIGRAIQEAMARDGTGNPQEAAGGPQSAGAVSFPSDVLKSAQEAAQAAGASVQEYILQAVRERLERDKDAGIG